MRGSVATLIKVHGLLSFLSDVYGLFDPSGKTLWLSVDYRSLRPVDDMVLLSCMVGDLLCLVILFWLCLMNLTNS